MSRLCEKCWQENPDNAKVCENCGSLLEQVTGQTAVPPAASPTAAGSAGTQTEIGTYAWKIRCPVSGREYDVENENSRMEFCECCNDEIDKCEIAKERPFSVQKSSIAQGITATAAALVMTELKTNKVLTITESGIIGRNGNIEPEYFFQDKYISEFHCKVIAENGVYKIEALPTVNPTKINGNILSKGIRATIRKGDFLTIADKVFEISVSDAAAQKEPDNVLPAAKTKSAAQYTITCPKCGTVYEIENMDHRITECSNCDEYDKHEISGIRAKAKNAN